MIDAKLLAAAKHLLDLCRARGLRIATAESCTGGLVAGVLTEIAGASDVVERGFVVYSNAAKESMLGVPASTLKRHGAVSAETAIAMAAGALKNSEADISVAITGIAGPGGGTKQKAGRARSFCRRQPRRQAHRAPPAFRQNRPPPRARALGRGSARTFGAIGGAAGRTRQGNSPDRASSERGCSYSADLRDSQLLRSGTDTRLESCLRSVS